MPEATLLVVANPYCALDEEGNPVGALRRTDLGPEALIGAVRSVAPDGTRTLVWLDEPKAIPANQTHRRWLQHGEILPADEATAREVGIAFVPVAEALAKAKANAAKAFQQATGRLPPFAEAAPAKPAAPASETTKAAKAGG